MNNQVQKTPKQDHNAALDGLRFVSFFAVYFFHGGMFPPGRWGVVVFFVLSGFLIGRILLAQRDREHPLSAKLKTFYIRRSLRIFPLYYLVLIGLVIQSLCHSGYGIRFYALAAVYLTNFWFVIHGPIVEGTHFWTLAIEEQFYLLAPIVLLTLSLRTIEKSILILWVLAGAFVIFNEAFIHDKPLNSISPISFCYLGVGVAAAMCEMKGQFWGVGRRGFYRIATVSAVVLSIRMIPPVFVRLMPDGDEVYAALVALASAGLVLFLWRETGSLLYRLLSVPPLPYLGQISYGLYVYHCIVLNHFPSDHRHHRMISSFLITVAASVVSWHLFERPINNLKDPFCASSKAEDCRSLWCDTRAAARVTISVMHPDISVIICTRDRAESLAQTLAAIGCVHVPEKTTVELVIVDNGSTDQTAAVVLSAHLRNLRIRYLSEPKPGLARARNTGLANTFGDVIVFTDDDVRPPTNWLESMSDPIRNGKADLVAGGVKIPAHLDRPWLRGQLRSWFAATDHIKPPEIVFVGANMAFSRRLLRVVPKFDERLGAGALGGNEDYLFYLQAISGGCTVASALDCQVEHHFDRSRLKRTSILKCTAAYGRSAGYIAYHWKKEKFPKPMIPLAKKQVALMARRLWNRPWRTVEGCPEWERGVCPGDPYDPTICS